MHARESNDPISVIKYATMMAGCSRQAWAVYAMPGQRLIARPYTGAKTNLIEVCRP